MKLVYSIVESIALGFFRVHLSHDMLLFLGIIIPSGLVI